MKHSLPFCDRLNDYHENKSVLKLMQKLIFLVLLMGSHLLSMAQQDTLVQKEIKDPNRFKPSVHADYGIRLRNQEGTFARKMWRGGLLVHGFEALGYGGLAVLPTEISGWKEDVFKNYGANMRRAFTQPPVFDHDKWYFNYVGHPYQGAAFYNAVRSQNANIWQSSLFCVGQVLVWEYVIESGLEQPCIQDLIVTPIAGILLGEGIHRATMAMAKNGFKWYEKTAVI
ncbi:MAG: DUF3943 domain-containing protein, partial [Flavobacteriales bacterium]|nr:DUF3943 domain-containing protein [Flavobacteriales bacterium]